MCIHPRQLNLSATHQALSVWSIDKPLVKLTDSSHAIQRNFGLIPLIAWWRTGFRHSPCLKHMSRCNRCLLILGYPRTNGMTAWRGTLAIRPHLRRVYRIHAVPTVMCATYFERMTTKKKLFVAVTDLKSPAIVCTACLKVSSGKPLQCCFIYVPARHGQVPSCTKLGCYRHHYAPPANS